MTAEPCEAEVWRGGYYDPPEFCDEEALPGTDFCAGHDPDALEDYLVTQAEARREDALQ